MKVEKAINQIAEAYEQFDHKATEIMEAKDKEIEAQFNVLKDQIEQIVEGWDPDDLDEWMAEVKDDERIDTKMFLLVVGSWASINQDEYPKIARKLVRACDRTIEVKRLLDNLGSVGEIIGIIHG